MGAPRRKEIVIFDRILRSLLVACLLPVMPLRVGAGDPSAEVQIMKGDMVKIDTKALTRVSITDPFIADISNATADGVTVIGKELGQTVLYVWDGQNKITTVIRVVAENLSFIKERIQSLLDSATLNEVVVTENSLEGKVVLTGRIPADKRTTLDKLVDSMAGKCINLVKDDVSENMIQIDMQVTELSTTLSKELGVDWFTGTQTADATTGQKTTTYGTEFSPIGLEVLPAQNGSVSDMFKIGNWYRSADSALVAKVNALIEEGRAHVLSKPRLVVMSGKEAKFLVGGEVPIKTITTSAGGSSTESVTFKEYGVNLVMTPTIRDEKVDLLMDVEISDLDKANAQNGDVAFTTRTARTQLFLDDHQTIVLAGMIKKTDGITARRVPLLGSIPVLGMLFRSKKTPKTPNQDTEIVISLTPTIISSAAKNSARKAFQPQVPSTRGVERVRMDANSFVAVSQDVAPYARMVQERISAFIAYPYEAKKNGWQGVVKLALILKRDGSLRDAFVQESSGYNSFDQDALNTAKGLAPYAVIPANIKNDEVTLTIPIAYQFDSYQKNIK